MQLLAAAAGIPTSSPSVVVSSAAASIGGGQQSFTLNPASVLQNQWLQQQYYQRLLLQHYLENCQTAPVLLPSSLTLPTAIPPATSVISSKVEENTIFPSLDVTQTPTTNSYACRPTDTTGLVAPVPKRARLVLPTISVDDQKRILEQQPQVASEPTQAVQAEPPRASARGLPSAFTPTSSHPTSPAVETSSSEAVVCSPSTSIDTTATTNSAKEDDEPELFIDIESVDNRPEGRDRRKAYIDFYRKVKSARQRERGQLLNCALCDCQVLSNDNAIHTHVNHHADAGGFWCKLCGLSEIDKYRIYEHMRVNHPNNMELFEDRRDIVKLCAVIQECFPRVCARFKKENGREFDNIIRTIEEKCLTEVKCARCDTPVKPTKAAMTKHAHQHPVYRCKACKFTSEDVKAQEEHQVGMHTALDPKLTVDYNVCSAADVLARTVQRCFSHVLQSSDAENVEKTPTSKS